MITSRRPVREVFAERTALVAQVAALNAEQLRLLQLQSGLEFELGGNQRESAEPARRARDDAQGAIAEGERRKRALEARIEELDRELAAG